MTIVTRSAEILSVPIAPEGAYEIAKRSRGTPRIANRMLRVCVISRKYVRMGASLARWRIRLSLRLM